MGARGIGHIAYLTRIAPPRVGVVLNVGTAHVGEFGSREAIATAKGELVRGAAAPTASPSSTPTTPRCARWPRAPARAVVLVGRGRRRRRPRRRRRRSTPAGARLHRRRAAGRAARSRLGLVGEHHVGNALAVARGRRRARPVARRRRRRARVRAGRPAAGGWRSPSAPTASRSSTTPTTPTPTRCGPRSRRSSGWGEGRRTWAVLGHDARARRRVRGAARARSARRSARAASTGSSSSARRRAASRDGAAAADGTWAPETSGCVADADAAEALLRAELRPGDVVLFKSSRDAGLRLLGDRLAGPREEQA